MNTNFYKKILKDGETEDDNVYKNFLIEEMILRDHLAVDRTILSNEATFLSYIRTSLTMLVAGVTFIHFSTGIMTEVVGGILVLIGLFVFVFGCFKSVKMSRRINVLKNKKETIEKITE